MSAIAFDTLAYVKKLKAVGVPNDQAEIQSETIAQVMEERIATKHDMDMLETNLKHEMEDMKTNLKHEMAEIKTNLKHDMAEIEANLKHDMAEMKTSLKHDMAEMKRDMKEHELAVSIKIEELRNDMIRWQIGTSVATVGVLFALLKFNPV